MSRANIPDEQPPFSVESRLRDYLARMFRACKQTVDALFRWTVDHVALTAPDYKEDPHYQYWHKVLDPAFFSSTIANPLSFIQGDTLAPWTSDIDPYGIQFNQTTGEATFAADGTDNGIYSLGVYFDVAGDSRGSYTFDFYVNGVPAGINFRLLFGNQQADGHITWVKLISVNVTEDTAIKIVCTSATGGFDITTADWSMHRISPGAGSPGSDVRVGIELHPGIRVHGQNG